MSLHAIQPTLRAAEINLLVEQLQDLGEYGIHVSNPRGICYRCGRPIVKNWSRSISADARCKACYDSHKDPKTNSHDDPAYNEHTLYVTDRIVHDLPVAIVKIDGRLLECHHAFGGSFDLYDAITGQRSREFGLHFFIEKFMRASRQDPLPGSIVVDVSPRRPIVEGGVTFEFEVNLSNRSLMLEVVRHIQRAGLFKVLLRILPFSDQGIALEGWTAIYVADTDVAQFREIYASFKQPILGLPQGVRESFMGLTAPSRRQ